MALRAAEIKKLEEEYAKQGNNILVFYGRTGCSKEQYLKFFLKDKEYFYYRAREASLENQRRMMKGEIEREYQTELPEDNYHNCFKKIRSSDGSKFVLVIDEFQHIAKKDADFIKSMIDLKTKKIYPGPILILLCSSSLVWVETKMKPTFQDYYKKIDAVHKIGDLNFLDVVRAFPDYSVSQCIQIYGVLGGIPAYLEHWDAKLSFHDNVCRNILSPEGFLFAEAESYIGSELRELSVYNTILSAIASGRRKLNDLFQYTGFSRAKISVYLKNLMEFDVVEKVVSFETGGWDNTQKGVYQIKNTFVNFWFRFIYPNLSDLYTMETEKFYEVHIEKEIEAYLNRYFIEVCVEYVELLNKVGKLPIEISKIGTWIGKQGTIDIIAQNSIRENIVGICNWSEPEMTFARCEDLFESMAQARISAKQYFFFSAKSFDKALVKKAKEDPAYVLIDMTEL